MSGQRHPIIESIVLQHIENAADLRARRSVLVRAPNVRLFDLARHDERLDANLDGIAVAGEQGALLADRVIERFDEGEVFVAGFCAIQRRDARWVDRLFALSEESPAAARGMVSVVGWMEPSRLQGVVASWLRRPEVMPRYVALAACAMHRVDPGPALPQGLEAADSSVRQRAFQAASELGRTDLLPQCLFALADGDSAVRFAAARAAVLLGDRTQALSAVRELAVIPGRNQRTALALAIAAVPIAAGRDVVRRIASLGAPQHIVIEATGWVGDPIAIDWLIGQMADVRTSRVAGEAFSSITGADLTALELEGTPPQIVEGAPTESADDDNIAIDIDENLPWPDPGRVAGWWRRNGGRFAVGRRSFVGSPPTGEHLLAVLKRGNQRQRIGAALLQAVSLPGRPLFNVAAPADRQRRLLTVS